MTTAEDFTCTVHPDFFDDEGCDYQKSDLRDTCPRHERNFSALTRRYITEDILCATIHNAAEFPLPEFGYSFARQQLSTDYNGYHPLRDCKEWSFSQASVTLLWSNGCPSDFERALTLTMQDGGAEMFELTQGQYEMLRHHTRTCGCTDTEFHDGLCRVECVEANGLPRRCTECSDRHCGDHPCNSGWDDEE